MANCNHYRKLAVPVVGYWLKMPVHAHADPLMEAAILLTASSILTVFPRLRSGAGIIT